MGSQSPWVPHREPAGVDVPQFLDQMADPLEQQVQLQGGQVKQQLSERVV